MEITECVNSDFPYHKELLLKERICSLFPLKEVLILKRDAFEENHCSFQKSPFNVRNFISALAAPLPAF